MNERDRGFELLVRVARQTGLDTGLLVECVERRLLPTPQDASQSVFFEAACRIRRLSDLGVNLAGMEIATHMRRRLRHIAAERDEMRLELERLRTLMAHLDGQVMDLEPFMDEH